MSKKPVKSVSSKKPTAAPSKQPRYTKRLAARRKRKVVHFFKNPTIIRDRIMASAKPGGIVLSHGIYQTTADAYKQIIPGLINQGYSLVSITDMFDIDPSNPEVRAYYSYSK